MGFFANIAGVFRARAENRIPVSPRAPDTFQVDLPNREDGLEELQDQQENLLARCIGSTFGISYVDAKNDRSRRRVTIRNVRRTASENLVLQAYCHERKAARCFRVDRIVEIVDLDTGEVFDDPFSYLGLIGVPGFTGTLDETDTTLDECRYGAQILVYLARCDGEYHPAEHEVILRYIADAAKGRSIDSSKVDRYASKLAPDIANFFDSLEEFSSGADDDDVVLLLRHVIELVEADGVIHDEERFLVSEIRESLEANGFSIH